MSERYEALEGQTNESVLTPEIARALNGTSATVPADLLSGPIPTEIRALRSLLTRIDNSYPARRAEQIAMRDRRDQIAKAIFAIEQVPPAPVIDANAQAAMRMGFLKRGEHQAARVRKLQELQSKLRGILDLRNDWLTASEENFPLNEQIGLPPHKRLALQNENIARLHDARIKLADFEIFSLEHDHDMFPKQGAIELKQLLPYQPDITKAKAMAAQIDELSSPGAAELAVRYHDESRRLYDAAKSSLVALVECAIDFLKGYETGARAIEVGFFDRFGLASSASATEVSQRYTRAVKQLQAHLADLTSYTPSGPIPSYNAPVLQFFGLSNALG